MEYLLGKKHLYILAVLYMHLLHLFYTIGPVVKKKQIFGVNLIIFLIGLGHQQGELIVQIQLVVGRTQLHTPCSTPGACRLYWQPLHPEVLVPPLPKVLYSFPPFVPTLLWSKGVIGSHMNTVRSFPLFIVLIAGNPFSNATQVCVYIYLSVCCTWMFSML